MSKLSLSPTRPYLVRAIYEWICDNQLTPYLLVDATRPNTLVPQEHIKDGQIVLNIAPHAVQRFEIANEIIRFSARFGGVARELYVPMAAIMGIYARENNEGLFFDPNEYAHTQIEADALESDLAQQMTAEPEPAKKKSNLRIVEE